ncbi:DNA-binding transcriptional regulator, HxlR family [Mucilaginibacter gossypiicola]|uniref:DNA-binding transcriptional regulator, HxlR family n=1 Tax=Mucilaginibacter gossypiicola TaxID=551995 RepID=A0A1H8D0A6_9SPHI|nr:helix-turn-helix domain-containing protein [Mucilaginibacter gossypiicola]SEN00763.1 DNA-binding transcriptional regulator, HxlR family [Mucilaginibacter gossypiicola]
MEHTSTDCKELFLSMQDFGDLWSGKWKIQIILYLSINKHKPVFFTQMRNDIIGISAKMLSKELKTMEMNQLITRIVHATNPVTVEYRITAHGETFAPVAQTMILWSVGHRRLILNSFPS